MDDSNSDQKDALKRLREQRKGVVARNARESRRQARAIKSLKERLNEKGGATVPEIAGEMDIPASEVLYYIATLKKYGEVAEGDKDGSFFRYLPVAVAEGREG